MYDFILWRFPYENYDMNKPGKILNEVKTKIKDEAKNNKKRNSNKQMEINV